MIFQKKSDFNRKRAALQSVGSTADVKPVFPGEAQQGDARFSGGFRRGNGGVGTMKAVLESAKAEEF